MSGPATVLVVDPSWRDDAAAGLTAAGHAVRTAADAADALRELGDRPAQVVVLGEEAAAPDACRSLRDAHPAVALVAIAARDSVDDRCALLEAGADDCLSRPYAPRELAVRVQAAARRGAAPADELAYADLRLDVGQRTAWRGGRPLDLTDTERRLLARLLERPERVVGRRELMLGVWGYDPGPASNALGVYVGYLRRKLELGGEPRLVHTVRGAGYVLRAARNEELHKRHASSLTDAGPAPSLPAVALSPRP